MQANEDEHSPEGPCMPWSPVGPVPPANPGSKLRCPPWCEWAASMRHGLRQTAGMLAYSDIASRTQSGHLTPDTPWMPWLPCAPVVPAQVPHGGQCGAGS